MLGSEHLRGKSLYHLMRFACSMAFCLYGYDAAVLGGVQETPQFRSAIGNPTGPWIIPMIASSYVLAAAVCSMAVIFIGMPLGRRGCILMGDLCVIIGGILQASSHSVPQIIVGRIICGFGVGFISCSVPTYMTEMSIRPTQRAPEVAFQCVILIWGVAIAYWLSFAFTRMTNQFSWRFPVGFQVFFVLCSGSALLLLPDTPRWYYAKDRYEEGDRILCRLWDREISDPEVQAMKTSILAAIKLEDMEKSDFNPMWLVWDTSNLRIGRRIRIACLLMAVQQMMGINMVVFYLVLILAQLNLSTFLTSILAGVVTTFFAISTIPLVFTIEKLGRRTIMIGGSVVIIIALSIFMAMIGIPEDSKSTATQWVGVVMIILFHCCFGYAWNGVPWLYPIEIAPLKYRHAAAASQCVGEWVFGFITVFGGGIALNTVGWRVWFWCWGTAIVSIPFIWFMCPETLGKSLEEIDLIFTNADLLSDSVAREIRGQGEVEVFQHPSEKSLEGLGGENGAQEVRNSATNKADA